MSSHIPWGDPSAAVCAEEKMASREKTILFVVDDEPAILRMLRWVFEGEGYQVYTFDSAVAAREAIREIRPHLVISDNYMPKLEGVVFLREIRQTFPAIHTLLLTGGVIDGRIEDAVATGEIDVLVSKPWDAKDLKARVRELVERPTSSI